MLNPLSSLQREVKEQICFCQYPSLLENHVTLFMSYQFAMKICWGRSSNNIVLLNSHSLLLLNQQDILSSLAYSELSISPFLHWGQTGPFHFELHVYFPLFLTLSFYFLFFLAFFGKNIGVYRFRSAIKASQWSTAKLKKLISASNKLIPFPLLSQVKKRARRLTSKLNNRINKYQEFFYAGIFINVQIMVKRIEVLYSFSPLSGYMADNCCGGLFLVKWSFTEQF